MNVSYVERRQFLFGWSTGCVEGMNNVFSQKKKKRFLVDLKMPISGRFALTEFDDKRERESFTKYPSRSTYEWTGALTHFSPVPHFYTP